MTLTDLSLKAQQATETRGLLEAAKAYVADMDGDHWCNRLKYGSCATRRCLIEAGWESGPVGGLTGICTRYRLDEAICLAEAVKEKAL